MEYRLLGHSGLRVSQLCLGAMTFGEEFGIGADEATSRRLFDAYAEAGGNFIDTANIYNRGTSERLVGRFVGSERHRWVIATKYTLSSRGDDPNAGGSHRKNLVQSIEDSLSRLGTGYIDLYWVHGWDSHTRMAEVMRALDDQVRLGKILHIGISNAPAWVVAEANTLAVERGLTPFTALQMHYNLVERGIEPDFLPLARAHHMAITAWSPLANGILSGKYNTGGTPGRLTGARAARILTGRNLEAARALEEIAREAGCSPARLALAWVCQRPGGIIPIIGARRPEQMEDNLGCTTVTLNDAQRSALDALAPPTLRNPESLLEGDFFRTLMYGPVEPRIRWPEA